MKFTLTISEESKEEIVNRIADLIKDSKDDAINNERRVKEDELGDEYLNVVEACKFFGCSKTTLYHYRKKGLIDYHQVGRKIIFRKSDLLKKRKRRFS